MKLVNKKNVVYINLAIGSIFIICIATRLLFLSSFNWFDLFMLGIGFYYLSKFYYLKTHPYLLLTNTHFVRFCILKTTRIPINSLKGYHIHKSGDFVLIGDTSKIWISSNSVNGKNLNDFKIYLSKMGINKE